jgi:hypothetical protein
VLVPPTSVEEDDSLPSLGQEAFERSDFDQVFQFPETDAADEAGSEVAGVPSKTISTPEGAWGTHAEPPFAFPLLPAAPDASQPRAVARGVVLSPVRATVLTVLVILLIVLAFGAGVLVGHFGFS